MLSNERRADRIHTNQALRAIIAAGLSLAMALGGAPAPALAEATGDVAAAQEQAQETGELGKAPEASAQAVADAKSQTGKKVDSNAESLAVTPDAKPGLEALAAEATPHVKYTGHVQRIGWQDYVRDGATAGTSGRSLRIEALHVYLENAGAGSYVDTRGHVQQIGWTNWQPGYCGTSGRGLRVEAIQLKLQGPIAKTHDIKYRVHVQSIGWMSWVKNGAVAGTSGRSLRIEAIQIKLVRKQGSSVTKPATPKLTSVSASGQNVTIKWAKQTKNTNGYEVQVASDKAFKNVVGTYTISSNGTTTKKLSNIGEGKTRYARVRAYRKVSGKTYRSAWSGAKSATTAVAKPVATSITSVSASGQDVTIKWAKQTKNANGYEVQVASDKAFENVVGTYTVSSTGTTTKKLSGVGEGETRYARVRTYRKFGGKTYRSAWSAAKGATTAVAKPVATEMQALDAADDWIRANWILKRDPAHHVDGYEVQWADNASFSGAKVVTVSDVNKFQATIRDGVRIETTYWARVRTWRKVGGKTYRSAWSSAKTGKTDVRPLTPIKSLTGLEGGARSLVATWYPLGDVSNLQDSYEVQYAKDASFKAAATKVVDGRSASTVTIDGLEDGTTYYVRIRTRRTLQGKTFYANQWSEAMSATTDKAATPAPTRSPTPAKLSAPTGLKAKATYSGADLTWNATAGADGYEVEWCLNDLFVATESLSASKASASINTVDEGSFVWVRVRATRGSERSDWSAVVSFQTTETPRPEKPQNVSASPAVTSANLSWDAARNAKGYVVEIAMRDDFIGSWTRETTVAKLSLTGLREDTPYFVRVRGTSTNSRGDRIEGDWSDTKLFFTEKASAPATDPTTPPATDPTTPDEKGHWETITVTDKEAWDEVVHHDAVTHIEQVEHVEKDAERWQEGWRAHMCPYCGHITLTSAHGVNGEHNSCTEEEALAAINAYRAENGMPPQDFIDPEGVDAHKENHFTRGTTCGWTNHHWSNGLGQEWEYDHAKTAAENERDLAKVIDDAFDANPFPQWLRDKIANGSMTKASEEGCSWSFDLWDPVVKTRDSVWYTDEEVVDTPAWDETIHHEAVTHTERVWVKD